MKCRAILVIVFVFCSTARAAQADPPIYVDTLLDHLVGAWVLRGSIAGSDTTHDVVAEWVLGHQYLRLREVARDQDKDGRPIYEAIVFIGAGQRAHQYACLWLDSTGGDGLAVDSIGRAMRRGDEMPFIFFDRNGKPSFKNTFVYDPRTDSWAWIMDNVANGKEVPFARVKLTRRQ